MDTVHQNITFIFYDKFSNSFVNKKLYKEISLYNKGYENIIIFDAGECIDRTLYSSPYCINPTGYFFRELLDFEEERDRQMYVFIGYDYYHTIKLLVKQYEQRGFKVYQHKSSDIRFNLLTELRSSSPPPQEVGLYD